MKPRIRTWMRKQFKEDKNLLKTMISAQLFAEIEAEQKEKKPVKKKKDEHNSTSKISVEN
jgi:hypothetical protein